MKVIENVTLYKCDYCAKKYQIKHFCEKHELRCSLNPINYMRCIDCTFAEKKQMDFIKWVPCIIHGEQEEESSIMAFWCSKKEHWIYPPTKVSNPIRQDNIEGEIKNEPMPSECDDFIGYIFK